MEGGPDEDEDEAAFIDAFFLPGGILDPEEEGNNKEAVESTAFQPTSSLIAERTESTPVPSVPPTPEGTSSLLFPASNGQESSSWLEPASTPGAEPNVDSSWLGQHLLGKEDLHFDATMVQASAATPDTTRHGSSDSMSGAGLVSAAATMDQPSSLASLSQIETTKTTSAPISSWMSASTEQWTQHPADANQQLTTDAELSFHEAAPEHDASSADSTRPIHIPTKPPPGFERSPLLSVEKPSLSAEAPSFQPASTLISEKSEKSESLSEKNESNSNQPTISASTEKVSDVKKGRAERRGRNRAKGKKTKTMIQSKPSTTPDVKPQPPKDTPEVKKETTFSATISEKEKNTATQPAVILKKNKNPVRAKAKPPARSTPVVKSENHDVHTKRGQVTTTQKTETPSTPRRVGIQKETASPKKATTKQTPTAKTTRPAQPPSDVKIEAKKQSHGPAKAPKVPESDNVAGAPVARTAPAKLVVPPPSPESKRSPAKDQKQHGKRKQKRQQEVTKEKHAVQATRTNDQDENTYQGLDLVGSGALHLYETSQVVYGFFHQYILWVSEILVPALKQSALLIASSALHSLRGVFLLLFAAFHTYSFAADETLAELNLESAWIPYVALVYAPTAARHMMNFVDLPQFTPHLVSSAVLCFLFRPVGVKRVASSSKPTPEDLRNILLIGCQILIPVDLLMDGFASVNTGIMTLCYADRLLLAYLISVIRKGWILSPFAWLSFSVQCLVSIYFPWRHILAEPILLFFLFSIGMASLNVLRSLEQMKQRAKKAKSLATQ